MTGKQIYESKERSCKWEELPKGVQSLWNVIFFSSDTYTMKRQFVMFVRQDNGIGENYISKGFWVELMDEIYELERKDK